MDQANLAFVIHDYFEEKELLNGDLPSIRQVYWDLEEGHYKKYTKAIENFLLENLHNGIRPSQGERALLFELYMFNHLDAHYGMKISILAEEYLKGVSPYEYKYPYYKDFTLFDRDYLYESIQECIDDLAGDESDETEYMGIVSPVEFNNQGDNLFEIVLEFSWHYTKSGPDLITISFPIMREQGKENWF